MRIARPRGNLASSFLSSTAKAIHLVQNWQEHGKDNSNAEWCKLGPGQLAGWGERSLPLCPERVEGP
jgi:hypothetical protein